MADKKITQLTNITGANLVDADEFVVVDTSVDETKSITLAELKTAFDSGSGFVRITGDSMSGDLTVPNLVVSGGVYLGGTGAANKLDDYEEGTWTPTFTTSGTDFGSITYDGITGGLYTKIGNMVHIQATIRTDAVTVGSASGSLYIGGLPYAPVGDTGTRQDSRAPLSVANVNNFATNQPSGARIIENSTTIALYYKTSSNGIDNGAQYTELNTGANKNLLRIAGSYIAS